MSSFADWLALREPADAAARSAQLADAAARSAQPADAAARSAQLADAGARSAQPADAAARSAELADAGTRSAQPADAAARPVEAPARPAERPGLSAPLVVHDLGSGTGSMVRWLAPRLRVPQHWVLHDRDAGLLALAARALPPGITVETRIGDLTRLTAADLAGASLVTGSALLDMLTAAEIERLVAACAGHPTLLTLIVIGSVSLDPPHPLDAAVAAAFDAHQRRTVQGRTLAGPDAADVAVTAFRDRGIGVEVRETPWRLGPDRLARAWFDGWVAAALEQEPALSAQLATYVPSRMEQLRSGRLTVSVGHRDLYAAGDS